MIIAFVYQVTHATMPQPTSSSNKSAKSKKKSVLLGLNKKDLSSLLWGPIDLIGTIRIGKGWAYGPIPSPKIREYPRTTSKERNENCTLRRGKEYLWRT